MRAEDLKVLDPEILKCNDPETFGDLLVELVSVDDAECPALVESLLACPNAIELVLSVTTNETPLLRWLMNQAQDTAVDTFHTSLFVKVLDRLSLYLLFLDFCFPPKTVERLRTCRWSVERMLRILQVLPSMTFAGPGPSVETKVEDYEDSDSSPPQFFIKVKQKQGHAKKAGRAAKQRIDHKPFEDLDIDIPATREEASHLTAQFIEDQKEIFEFYLSVLRRPELRDVIKKQYIPQEGEQAVASIGTDQSRDSAAVTDTGVEEDVPNAYPMVQPMKAALYFDNANGFGDWRVLISGRADRNLREARRTDKEKFRMIVKKIKELSKGHFSASNQKQLTGSDTDIPVFEAKMQRDLRLVYQVDCIEEHDSGVERQAIRVFGIYTLAQMDQRLWDSVGRHLGRRGKEYKRRCTIRSKAPRRGDDFYIPEMFSEPPGTVMEETASRLDLPKEHLAELHSLISLEKFVVFSQGLLNGHIADENVQHVFQVSPYEKDIIEHPYSCYVLGRSGTGKTTTMLFKMLGIERTWQLLGDGTPKPRQMFVTQSRVLAGKVEEYFLKLLRSLTAASHSLEELARTAKSRKEGHDGAVLIDLDDDANWRENLPQKFSLLADEHFPLFITFNRLCQMIEADIEYPLLETRTSIDEGGYETRRSMPLSPVQSSHVAAGRDCRPSTSKRQFVDYSRFRQEYWAHFPQHITKSLDPSLVFNEIIGIIKGSEEALVAPLKYLDFETYSSLSHRSRSTFTTQRETVYAAFRAYMKKKRTSNDYDAADRTHDLLQHMREVGLEGSKIDYLYVDEVQDNLLLDAMLLRSLCRNPDGLFWAGDTAQAISAGSSFRFDDLKAFLFHVEEKNKRAARKASMPPRSFQLAVNYRSHGGIVNCAHSVVQLITRFWPYAIDKLNQEKGVVDGPRPVFLGGWNNNNVRYEQFLFGKSEAQIEFGAQQCILVRDESARDNLQQQVGDPGIIMTLYESKGLEFDDVCWNILMQRFPSFSFSSS